MKSTYKMMITALLATAACGGDSDLADNENEVITTVTLTFTPAADGVPMTFEIDDPDGDGGAAPTVDSIELAPGIYSLAVGLENRLEMPAEDITAEVADEGDEHQLFFTGSAVDGPATANPGAPLMLTYSDQDRNALPIGLTLSVNAIEGTGELIVTLRHLPPLNDEPAKTAELAAEVRDGGFAAIGGSTDAQVSFPVTVQ